MKETEKFRVEKVEKFSGVILVFYVNIGNLKDDAIVAYMDRIKKKIMDKSSDTSFKDSVPCQRYFLPIRKGETRVECINPQPVSDNFFSKIQSRVSDFNEILGQVEHDGKKEENLERDVKSKEQAISFLLDKISQEGIDSLSPAELYLLKKPS